MSILKRAPSRSALPTHLDLPYKDDKPVENDFQIAQSSLLLGSLNLHLEKVHPDGNFFIGADNAIYWELKPERLDGCRAPDLYFVPGVPKLLNGMFRNSYVIWQEKERPLLVAEYVSGNGSEEHDTTPEKGKFWVYENGIRAKYYMIYDPKKKKLEIFKLRSDHYRRMRPNAEGRYRVPEMQLEWGLWVGKYHGNRAEWIRAWDLNGNLIPTPEELVDSERRKIIAEKQRAETEHQRAESEKQRADRLAAKLRELGVNPDAV